MTDPASFWASAAAAQIVNLHMNQLIDAGGVFDAELDGPDVKAAAYERCRKVILASMHEAISEHARLIAEASEN